LKLAGNAAKIWKLTRKKLFLNNEAIYVFRLAQNYALWIGFHKLEEKPICYCSILQCLPNLSPLMIMRWGIIKGVLDWHYDLCPWHRDVCSGRLPHFLFVKSQHAVSLIWDPAATNETNS
jgi:hypothetical protein